MPLLPRVILQRGEKLDGTLTPLHTGFKPAEPQGARPRRAPQRASIPTHRWAGLRDLKGASGGTAFEVPRYGPSPLGKCGGRNCSYAVKNHKFPPSSLSFPSMWPHHLLGHPTWLHLSCRFTLIPTSPPKQPQNYGSNKNPPSWMKSKGTLFLFSSGLASHQHPDKRQSSPAPLGARRRRHPSKWLHCQTWRPGGQRPRGHEAPDPVLPARPMPEDNYKGTRGPPAPHLPHSARPAGRRGTLSPRGTRWHRFSWKLRSHYSKYL